MDFLLPNKKWSFVSRLRGLGTLVPAGMGVASTYLAKTGLAATDGGQSASYFLFYPLAVTAMRALVSCIFRCVASLALLVLLSKTQTASAQTLAAQAPYQAPGLRTVIKAQPNSACVRVRYESNNPGPVYIEFLNAKGGVVYTERKRETHFVGNYDLASLPAGDYALHLATSGFHHVEVLRLNRDNNARVTVEVIRPNAFQTAYQSLFPPPVSD